MRGRFALIVHLNYFIAEVENENRAWSQVKHSPVQQNYNA